MINAQGTYEAHSTEPGTALLLAAAPAGKGCLIDAATVLPALAAVPPSALTGTPSATVVELADPLDPQTVLTRIRTAAALPGPLHLYVTGQLHLDHRQRLLHFALARTTPATLRYTGLPWHWLTGELALRRPHTTTLVLDLVADAAAWQHVRDGGLGLGHGVRLYGRVAPPPPRRTLLTPAYLKAYADIWRAGERPAPAQLHEAAAMHAGPPGALFLAQDTQYPAAREATGTRQAPTERTSGERTSTQGTPAAPAQDRPAQTIPAQPAPGRSAPERPSTQATPATDRPAPAGPAHAPSPAPAPTQPASPRRESAPSPAATSAQPAPSLPAPTSGGSVPVPAAATRPAQPAPSLPAPTSGGPASVGSGAAPSPRSTPARPAPAVGRAAPAASAAAPGTAPAAPARPRPTSAQVPRSRPAAGGDPHPALLAAAQAGRHGEASAIAALWESEALRTYGAGSPQAIHWLEVRADLARLAQDPPRSCELWSAVAEARLARGEAGTSEDVEAAVDRAHHQWEQVADPARARAQAGALRALRRRVPGRRPGALDAIQRRLDALRA
ncbi:hypothetical protein [Streptomyces sp. NPDC006552]|uniref:hypothetical protein n=1 Tax=Streptomyces sp. NPDC006552 TaxID=3157179 RepID=UPI0033A1936F